MTKRMQKKHSRVADVSVGIKFMWFSYLDILLGGILFAADDDDALLHSLPLGTGTTYLPTNTRLPANQHTSPYSMIRQGNLFVPGLYLLFLCCVHPLSSLAFTMQMSNTGSSKEIYGIPNSGWAAKEWNWGSAVGTGHDCALICRREYNSRSARKELVSELMNGKGPTSFEQVKLVLGLAWQRGRWDGSDGGPGGYGEVLNEMAKAKRYEIGNDCDVLFVEDIKERYHLLKPNDADMDTMMTIDTNDVDVARRKCSGLVLKSMGFIDGGL